MRTANLSESMSNIFVVNNGVLLTRTIDTTLTKQADGVTCSSRYHEVRMVDA